MSSWRPTATCAAIALLCVCRAQPPSPLCHDFAHAQPQIGRLSSPNWPRKYPPHVDCERVIEAPAAHAVQLTFEGRVFEIEPAYESSAGKSRTSHHNLDAGARCPGDYLEIRDGKYGFSPLLARFCQMRHPQTSIVAASGTMWLYFHSDELLEYHGFTAKYQFVPVANESAVKRESPA